MKIKKVLIVATVVKTHIITFHIPLLKILKDKGYEVHIAAKNDYENPEDCKIPHCDVFHDIPFERSPLKFKNFLAFKKLKQVIETNHFDVIHCNTPVGGALSRLAVRETRKFGAKVIYTAHGFHFYDGAPLQNWLLYYPVERFLARYTDILITINQEDYIRANQFKTKKIEYVPGIGVDLKKYTNVDLNLSNKIRYHLGLKEDDMVLLSIGELNNNKNHQIVIKALGKLQNKSIHYLIAGEGPLKEELIKLGKKLGVDRQMHLLGYRNDIPELLRCADIFIFPSTREGLSLSLMEAMATGLPIIASDIRGNRDLIDDNRGGFLCETNYLDNYIDKIQYLYSNSDIRKKFGSYNLEKIKKFSSTVVNQRMNSIYELNK